MKIIKKAIQIGNGAAVYIPKEYSGKEITIVLPESMTEIKQRILTRLIAFMSNIVGIYLYGSYVRQEQTKDSDIDVLIITKEKDEKIKNVLRDMDVRVISMGEIKRTIQEYPVLIMPIIKEALVLLNPVLLEELKKEKIDTKKFKWNFDEIKRTVKITEKFVEIDPVNISPIHIYSLIMRIRVCYLIECLLKNKKYSNKDVELLLINEGLKKDIIDKFFYIYREIREDRMLSMNIEQDEIAQLIAIVKKYVEKLYDESKKKIAKRN